VMERKLRKAFNVDASQSLLLSFLLLRVFYYRLPIMSCANCMPDTDMSQSNDLSK